MFPFAAVVGVGVAIAIAIAIAIGVPVGVPIGVPVGVPVGVAVVRSIAYSGRSKDQYRCVVGLDHRRYLQRSLVGDVSPLGVEGNPIPLALARYVFEQFRIGGDSIRPLYRVGCQIGREFKGNVLGGFSKAAQESSFGLLGCFVVVVVVVVVVVGIDFGIVRGRISSTFCWVGREIATGNPGPSHGRLGGHPWRDHTGVHLPGTVWCSHPHSHAGVESHLGSGAKG